MSEQVNVPEGSCDPMESLCLGTLLSAPVALWRGAHAGAGLLAGPVAPWEGPHAGAEEEHEEEGAAETTCDELTATPAPCPLHCSVEGCGEARSEDEPRKTERGRGKVFFRFVLISHYPTLILTDSTLNQFSQVKSVLPMTVIGECSLCPYLKPQALSLYFLPPSC